MSLGHVCTRVRAILRGCQSIWAENVYAVNDPICRELFLQQAGDAPLALVVKTQLDNNDALSRLPRARSIWTNQNDLTMTMLHPMPSPTKRSLLQHLTLDLDADFMEIWNSMYPEPTLPTIDFPSLHSLHLTNVNALFTCNNLSELIISDDINRPGMGYSSNEFLAVLRGCPRIQNLDLSYTLPFFSPLSSSNEIVKLDLLERLTVKSFRKCSLSFWPCISVPHTTEVEFKLDCRSTDSDDAYRGPDTFDDARLFRAHLDGIPVKDVQLCLSGDVQGQLPVVLSLRMLDNGVHKHILTLGYFNYAHDVQTHDAVCRMRDALRLAEVEKLILSRITFSSAFSDDAASWRALLLLFPKVQSLGTDLQWFQKLCFALWWTGRVPSMDPENTSSQSEDAVESPALPGLRYLCIDYEGLKEHTKRRLFQVGEYLAQMLNERAHRGLSLRTLKLDELAGATVWEVQQLRRQLLPLVPYLQLTY
ncbi:hypothetical protein PENSPDRAFT_753620 [Peniophora sp. CONT]|nr:hypothetical protein PENSPDRAFT_753620 [Peniophora sp. CONT]